MRAAASPDTQLFALFHWLFCGRCGVARQFRLVQFATQRGQVCYECPSCDHMVRMAEADAPRRAEA